MLTWCWNSLRPWSTTFEVVKLTKKLQNLNIPNFDAPNQLVYRSGNVSTAKGHLLTSPVE